MTILERFEQSAGVQQAIERAMNSGRGTTISGAFGMASLLFSLAYARATGDPLINIFSNNDRLNLFEGELHWLLEEEQLADRWNVTRMPDYDIPEIDSPAAIVETRRHRLKSLASVYLEGGPTPWVLATIPGATRKTLPAQLFRDMTLFLREGGEQPMPLMLDALARSGYQRRRLVESAGQFTVRGGMIDIFPAQSDMPVRVEMAGDVIDEIRLFNTETQRSSKRMPEVIVCPCTEAAVHMSTGDISLMRKDHASLMERGVYFDGAILYPEVFGADANPLADGSFGSVLYMEHERCTDESERLRDEALKWMEWNDFEDPESLVENIYVDPNTAPPSSAVVSIFAAAPEKADEDKPIKLPVSLLPPLPMKLTSIAEKIFKELKRGDVVIISRYKKRLDRFLFDEDITGFTSFEGNIHGGIRIDDSPLCLFTDSDMFGRPSSSKSRAKKQRASKDRMPIRAPEDISEGDHVVHVDHGVGIYLGMERQSSGDGYTKDFFKLQYGRGDVLFVPIDQLTRIEKYIGAETALPKIYPLHSTRWAKVKQKVRKKVEEIAGVLYNLYQDRENMKGYSFGGDNVFMQELDESFPFDETEDQERTIREVLSDMEGSKPMDRLVYGDVGFGKTEVAVRAALKATLDKKQVAILAPTTILAHQHGQTFEERLSRFPVSIGILSRFKSRKEQKEVLDRLEKGELDIIIGTHRLLSKDVKFKDLGLLVIDEEQRFGVKHKETIKMIKKNVDVLTLTATPIPRTLNMSMIGLRDMSLITTPPEDRRSVKTFVEPFNTQSLYIAIERELARDGQIYYVHNDIASIEKPRKFIENSFPDAQVAVTHGKMPERQIEQTMIDFYRGDYDILISTTIIENGLDIPNVNTLIVVGGENFGLGQLYQLRGRVGRSYRQSYAYIFHSPTETLSSKSRARLTAIRELADLGSGYRLAMKDLEIRGSGNILGKEQHGYMREVGFHLYCQMLEESVQKIRGGEREKPLPPVEVDFSVDSFLPEDYVEGTTQRTFFYKRLMACRDDLDINTVEKDLRDRFGALPLQARRFVNQERVRLLAAELGIVRVKTHPKRNTTELTFHTDEHRRLFQEGPYPIALTVEVDHLPGMSKIEHAGLTQDRVLEQVRMYLKFVRDDFRAAGTLK